jgi:hypothetical protein
MIMSITKLLDNISPLYSKFKRSDGNDGLKQLKQAWEIGYHLNNYINTHNIAPHALYREIYGKSEGAKDIAQKSYIPREFQGRCYRIYNLYKDKHDLDVYFPTLASFTLFREAMPFLDNKKYKFEGKEKDDLIKLLNSKNKITIIMKEIRILLKKNIGITNSRKQKLGELDSEKDCFIKFYNMITAMTCKNKEQIEEILSKASISDKFIISGVRDLNAMSRDGLKYSETLDNNMQESLWKDFYAMLESFKSQNDPKQIRRFRRIIPDIRMVHLADMLVKVLAIKNKDVI